MSPTASQFSLRVRGLAPGTSRNDIETALEAPIESKATNFFKSRLKRSSPQQQGLTGDYVCCLAAQSVHLVGIVTFQSAKEKQQAVERLNKKRDWLIDSDFIGLTGGLVVRESMIRLHRHSGHFDNIELSKCGMVFLSTPHSGTTEADWNQFLLNLCEITLGVRAHAIVNELKSFNPSAVDSEEEFRAMPKMPPLHCFCEGDRTSVAGAYRLIVTQASAGFCGHKADKILNVDHHQICKADNRYSPTFLDIFAKMGKVRALLVPGLTGKTVGIPDALDSDPQLRVIALTGIGGIGKTEILLEIAFRLRDLMNIFSIRAADAKGLENSLLQIATSMGHDLLSFRFKDADLASIWRHYVPDERIHAFKDWLGSKTNQPTIFIVDDLDGVKDENLIAAALSPKAQVILYSARDPTIMENVGRHGEDHHISNMEVTEIISLMRTVLQRSGSRNTDYNITDNELAEIAEIVGGHALGACRAIAYILNVLSQTSDTPAAAFIRFSKGPDWKARKRFIAYKPSLGFSVIQTFASSIDRMQSPREATIDFLELITFLGDNRGLLHSRDFFTSLKSWIGCLKDELPDYALFSQDSDNQNEYLLELERVSIGMRLVVPGPLQIHPLWIECVQQRAGHTGRLRWLRQIMTISYTSCSHYVQHHGREVDPFAKNAVSIAARFAISSEDLCSSNDIWNWFQVTFPEAGRSRAPGEPARNVGEVLVDQEKGSKTPAVPYTEQDAVQGYCNSTLQRAASSSSERHTQTRSSADDSLPNKIASLHQQCEIAKRKIAVSDPEEISEGAFKQLLGEFMGRLRILQKIEESEGLVSTLKLHRRRCIEVYDMLIEMAPFFHQRSSMLKVQLERRRESFRRVAT
ncbi:MAG: hypothetical protein Q9219_006189 [cf. Caloplaca sp. 3 TL-2023]